MRNTSLPFTKASQLYVAASTVNGLQQLSFDARVPSRGTRCFHRSVPTSEVKAILKPTVLRKDRVEFHLP